MGRGSLPRLNGRHIATCELNSFWHYDPDTRPVSTDKVVAALKHYGFRPVVYDLTTSARTVSDYATKASYDAAGRLVTTEAWANAVSVTNSATIAQVATATGSAGAKRTTATTYDGAGRVYTETDSGGVVTRFEYYANGQLGVKRVALGTADEAVTVYGYDGAGRLTTEIFAHGMPEQIHITHGYDGLGNRILTVDPRNQPTNYSYDRLGRMVSRTDALGKVTAFEYNRFGETTKVTDALGRITVSAYDRLGRVTSITDALSGVTAFEYTRFGDLWKQTDARGNASYSWYDRLGRATLSRDAEGYVTQTSYTAFSEVASVTRRHAVHTGTPVMTTPQAVTATATEDATTTFSYDRRGLLTKSADALWDSAAPLARTERFTYNAYGERLTAINKLDATTSYAYDNRGLLISETRATPTRNVAGVEVAATVTTTYGYDLRGNRTQMSVTAAVGALRAPRNRARSGSARWTRALSTPSSNMMVRASSPCKARW